MGHWLWVVYALAVARVAGLVVSDDLTATPRGALQHRLGRRWLPDTGVWLPAPTTGREAVASLITCQWCASMWIAAVAAPLAYWWGGSPWLLIPALALAMSQVTGLMSNLGRT